MWAGGALWLGLRRVTAVPVHGEREVIHPPLQDLQKLSQSEFLQPGT